MLPILTNEQITYCFSSRFSFGLADFQLLDLSPPRELTTFSITPGIQINFNVNRQWQIKPFTHAGPGFILTNPSDLLYLTNAGLKSHYQLSIGGWQTSIGHQLQVAKYHEKSWSSDTLISFSHGVDVVPPFHFRPWTSALNIGFFAINTLFNPKSTSLTDDLSWTLKLGFHIGQLKPTNLKFRGGLYYVAGDERLRGIRITLGVPL